METRSSMSHNPPPVVASGPNVCRVCLVSGAALAPLATEPKPMESIFTIVGEYEDQTLFSLLVAICAPLGQREMLPVATGGGAGGAPERICQGCKWRLLAAYELHRTCLRSDDKLRERVEAIRKKQQPVPEGEIRIKQEVLDPSEEQDFNQNSTMDAVGNFPFLLADHYLPDAESTLNATDLLQEMTPAEEEVDPNDTLFEENYKLNDKGNHSCGICEQEFNYKSQCRSHIIGKHDPSKPFKCDVCHYTLTTEIRLIRHKAVTHGVGVIKADENPEETDETGETIYTCKICTKTFNSIVRFKKHKSVHVAYNRPFKCDICQYRFPTRAQWTQHAKVHQEKSMDDQAKDQDNEWPCEHCEEKLPGKRALTMHIRRFHPQELLQSEAKERNDYKCIICSEAFARESVLNTHMKMHELLAIEKEREQRHELEQLIKRESLSESSSFMIASAAASSGHDLSGSSLNIKKKSDADVAFVCMVCEQEFEERELLLRHQRKLHKELELNIVAGGAAQDDPNVPPADSTSPMNDCNDSSLVDDDSVMVVDIDPSQLLAPSSMESETNHKGRSGGPVPKCDICQKTFMYNSLLQQHVRNSHSESKPFECKVCRMRFSYRGLLQKHELTHSAQNIRPGEHGSMMFKCKVCSAQFLEMKALTVHLRIHRPGEAVLSKKVNIFQCTLCPQVFNEKVKLDEHVAKIHHKHQQPAGAGGTHMRIKPDFRRVAERQQQQPLSEKERFFGSLSIVKLEQNKERIQMETS